MPANKPGRRRPVDDRPAAGLDHRRDGVLRHHDHRGDVDPHGAVPGLRIDLDGVAGRPGHADDVGQDVERTERFEGTLDGPPARSLVGHVGLDEDRLATLTDDDLARLLGPLRALVDQGDLGALAGKGDRGGLAIADARRA